ncbi:MAG: polyprenyl synthetase family protein [Deltaproteobacteria bacterium]|nr:polyprenyl synthetase family protein [Deltaproteobacteria bacterium]
MTTIDPSAAPGAVRAWLDDARARIDQDLEERLIVPADDPGRLRAAMHYAATGPGKRLRPALTLAACEAVGGTVAAALPAASAIEMLHAYTLVHDDLPAMDDDDTRRGRPTVHIAFGEAIAILAGDGLLTMAFGALAELGAGAAAAVKVLAARAGAGELLGGQAIDLQLQARGNAAPTSLEEVEHLHRGKTGALFAAACELGAIAGGADTATRAALGRYGMAIGVAFQHADDRDDGELIALAAQATVRMRELTDEASAIARTLGARGAILDAVASWIGQRA